MFALHACWVRCRRRIMSALVRTFKERPERNPEFRVTFLSPKKLKVSLRRRFNDITMI
jgi:hypothetical protein